ncbi:GNAT family N-acetyltransferase [Intestinimonas timonensis]|uniref:GNAT family N-acetyltransferase n=1 Tax=Intestinimonas timonensis TaxID=1689270 RepID=UPI001031B515|nr:GNAT family N-acetyltransferase [Intestinimonas timonensis]
MDIRAVTVLNPGGSAGLPGGFQAWEGGRLVGSLTLFAPLGHTAEVSAFVPTEHRRRGIFSALLAEAETACWDYGAKRLLFVCGGESGDGQAVATHWGLALDHSEYVLVCKGPRPEGRKDPALRLAGPRDLEQVAALTGAAFGDTPAEALSLAENTLSDPARQCWGLWEEGRLIAAAGVGPAAEGLSIYSVAVDPARQGQGLGRRLMAGLLGVLPRDRTLVVEVDSGNLPARALYAAFGFRETRRQDYFARGL